MSDDQFRPIHRVPKMPRPRQAGDDLRDERLAEESKAFGLPPETWVREQHEREHRQDYVLFLCFLSLLILGVVAAVLL